MLSLPPPQRLTSGRNLDWPESEGNFPLAQTQTRVAFLFFPQQELRAQRQQEDVAEASFALDQELSVAPLVVGGAEIVGVERILPGVDASPDDDGRDPVLIKIVEIQLTQRLQIAPRRIPPDFFYLPPQLMIEALQQLVGHRQRGTCSGMSLGFTRQTRRLQTGKGTAPLQSGVD